MRKLLLIGAVAVTVGLASCTGDYTCTCKDHHGSVLATYPYTGAKHKDAKHNCATEEAGWKIVDPDAHCTLTSN